MSESKFSKDFRKGLMRTDAWRVENKFGMESGMPDLHFQTECGADGWIELKYIPRVTIRVKMQPKQPDWLFNYSNKGGCAMILVRVGEIAVYAFDGIMAKKLDEGIHVTELEYFCHTDPRMGWHDLEHAIHEHALRLPADRWAASFS